MAKKRWVLVALVAGLAVAALSIWGLARRADRELRAALLLQARLVAQALNVERIKALTGTQADLTAPAYQQLKTQFMSIGTANPQCKWFYLMGRKADGTIFFLVDSEAPDIADPSPPGQVYDEAPAGYQHTFDNNTATVVGPITDRWGVWVSALVPLTDPKTGAVLAVLGMDIDARMWQWDVAAKAALPAGLILVLLIGAATLLASASRSSATPKPILRRLLPPLAVMVTLLLAGAGVLLWQQHQQRLAVEIAADIAEAAGDLRTTLDQQAAILTALAQPIAADATVQRALRAGDADRLLADWQPVLETLRRKNRITHFYFFATNRSCLLRVHRPENRGDLINRFTAHEAERTAQTASGMELGVQGTFTLRVVQPVLDGGTLVGYVELGKEIGDALNTLHTRSGNQLAVIIRKEYLHRLAWEAGMRRLGREADWNQLPHNVVIYASQGRLPDAFTAWADQAHGHRETDREIAGEGQAWRVSAMPLQDAAGVEVGDLLVMRDVSAAKADFVRMVTLGSIAGSVLLALLMGFIYLLLRRTDAGIRTQQAALRESEEKYSILFANSPDACLILDIATGVFVDCNHAAEVMLCGDRTRIIGQSPAHLSPILQPDGRPSTTATAITAAAQQAGTCTFDWLHRRMDGTDFWAEVSATALTIQGRPVLFNTWRDITARKRAEEALRESTARFQEVLENSLDASYKRNLLTDTYDYLSPVYTRIAGYTPAEMEHVSVRMLMDLIHPDDVPEVTRVLADSVANAAGTEYQYEYRIKHKDGHYLWILNRLTVMRDAHGTPVARIGSVSDITARKRTEAALRESEANYRQLVEITTDWVWAIDCDGVHTYSNPAVYQLLGYQARDVVGTNALPLIHPDDAQAVRGMLHRCRAQKVGWQNVSIRWLHKSGTVCTFESSASPMLDAAGQVVGYSGVDRDITARTHAEEALRESESLLRESQIIAGLGSYVLDISADMWKSSDMLDTVLGIDKSYPHTLAGWVALIHPDDRTPMADYFNNDVLGQGQMFNKEYRIIRHDDRAERWVCGVGRLECDAQGRPLKMRGTIQDITARKQTEAELLKMQKLQSVGTLAGGIAHDFNNILMGLFGNISMAKDELAKEHPGYALLDEAEKSMHRAVRLTTQLLTFAKGGTPVKEDVSLGALVEEIARFDLSGSQVKLVYQQPEHLWLAEVDKGQMQQVVSNLVINARQAMPEGGCLYISLENATLPTAAIAGLPPGNYVKVSVRDEGTGIDPKHLGRIFDPYFTTKQAGNGLGLATVYSVITKHGGHIDVASALGHGTTFTFYLPATAAPSQAAAHPPAAPHPHLDHPARILVMDDEPVVCDIVTRMLHACGFEVATARDGQQAIARYQQALAAGTPFDVVIMDLTIPGGIGGKEAIKDILALDPHARAIVSSGYADDPVMANYADYGFKGIAAKPYTLSELRHVLQQVLQ